MKILADGEYPCDCGYETCETQLVVSRNGNLIGILDPNGVGFSVNFVLPDGIRLCREVPDGAGQGNTITSAQLDAYFQAHTAWVLEAYAVFKHNNAALESGSEFLEVPEPPEFPMGDLPNASAPDWRGDVPWTAIRDVASAFKLNAPRYGPNVVRHLPAIFAWLAANDPEVQP